MMFGKLLGRKKVAEGNVVPKAPDSAIEEVHTTDPLVHLRIGAGELLQRLLVSMKTEPGVHIESALAILGSLGGFSCIDSLLKQAAASGRSNRDCGIHALETSDGNRYHMGQPINDLLAGTKLSLWPLVAGMVDHLGSKDYPDFAEIAGHVAKTLGGPDFGHPRVPDRHQPHDLPINYVRDLWPLFLPQIEQRVPVLQERVTLFGFAIQNLMQMGKDAIPPAIAGKLVMDCAVPMSRLDPEKLWAKGD
jgi:hypothetical protein